MTSPGFARFLGLIEGHTRRMGARQAANIVHALSKMRLADAAAGVDAAVAARVRGVARVLVGVLVGNLGPRSRSGGRAQDVSNTLWGMGMLRMRAQDVDPAALTRMLAAFLERRRNTSPDDIANVLWGLARLGFDAVDPATVRTPVEMLLRRTLFSDQNALR